jgi:hypothetical protein
MSDDLRGLYKISDKLLYKLVKRRISTPSGTLNGASRYEILSVIHFTHIADSSGFIDAFRITELCNITGCSRREAYSVLLSMQEKGIISFTKSEFYGRYDITLHDSDFSSFGKGMRYLNTNSDYFAGNYYDRFRLLSHTAMRLFLLLSFKYDERYGYHVSFMQLKAELGLKHKSAVISALNELNDLISVDEVLYSIRKDEKRRLCFGFLDLPKSLITMRSNEGIYDVQPTWYKRRLERLIHGSGFESCSVHSPGNLFNKLFQIASHVFKQGKSLEFIENIIVREIEVQGCLNDRTLYNISECLSF